MFCFNRCFKIDFPPLAHSPSDLFYLLFLSFSNQNFAFVDSFLLVPLLASSRLFLPMLLISLPVFLQTFLDLAIPTLLRIATFYFLFLHFPD